MEAWPRTRRVPARTSSKTTAKPSIKTNGKASKAVVGSIGTLGDYLKEQRLSRSCPCGSSPTRSV